VVRAGPRRTVRPGARPRVGAEHTCDIAGGLTIRERRTLLTSEATVVLRGGRLGRLAQPLGRLQSRRLGRRSLAAFKHLVAEGSPPRVRHARLPRPMTTY
jgi:hypothetical protein